MARKTKTVTTVDMDIADIEAAIAEAEILAAETADDETPQINIVEALAEANGASEALAQAADEAQDEAADQAADEAQADDALPYADLVAAVTADQVVQMQASLSAAFADRAAYEQRSNPNNMNIQKTLSKVQKGHLAHGISQAMRAIGLDPNYLNKSEVSGKRRNVYALEKLQDLIYGAQTGHVKNAINAAVLVSLHRLETAGVPFTGAVAKACASDKIAVDGQLKALLRRHTVSESTASTQSSSTMTALEDLGAVVNSGTQKHPVWAFADTAIGKRLREVAVAMQPATV